MSREAVSEQTRDAAGPSWPEAADRPVRRAWPPTAWPKPYAVGAGAVVVLGALQRFLTYTQGLPTTSDEALSGLMARRLWHGEFSFFLWGQNFGGTPEVFPMALVTRLVPGSLLAERFTTFVLGAVAAYLAWRIASRLGGPAAGLVAGGVLWVWPPYFVGWSMHELLYYEPVIVLGLAALWWGIRTWDRPTDLRLAAMVGGAGGLAWWINPQAAAFAVPMLLALARVPTCRLHRLGVAAAAALVGAGPWLVFNVRHDMASLRSGSLDQHQSYVERLGVFVEHGAGIALGLERSTGEMVGPWANVVLLLVVGAMAVACMRAVVMWRRGLIDPPVDVAGVVLYPFILALSPTIGTKLWAPRYFFFAWPWVAFAAARLVSVPRKAAVQVAAVVGMLLLATSGAIYASSRQDFNWPPAVHEAARVDFARVARELESHEVDRLFTGYWYAYMLDRASDGRVIATPAVEGLARYKPWDREVRSSARPGWLFVPGSIKEQRFVAWLAAQRIAADTFVVGDLHAYVPERRVLPEEVPGEVIDNPTEGW